MENFKVIPNTISEGRAMELLLDGFRRSTRIGNRTVIVRSNQDGIPFVFTRSTLNERVEAANLLDADGRIVAVAHMDQFDR